MQAISKHSIVYTAHGAFVVVGCGNGRYTLQPMGSKSRYTMSCDEFHAELKAGKAILGNKDAFAECEAPRSYKRYAARLNAPIVEKVSA